MKTLLLKFIFFLVLISTSVRADEGMWLPSLLGNKVYNEMVKKGLKLTKEQLYSMNKNSIKDAIVLFGPGCTGEIVSKEGLLFTNHHCGYDNIASVSTVAHNYLKDGFWAKNKQEEIACNGLTVQFLIKIEDVTEKVNAKLKELKPNEISSKLQGVLAELSAVASKDTPYEVRISNFFKGNQFLQFTYQRFKDVRLVGTPPESIGKFGGDTDNWEWPRHTGDFSIFRVYTDKNGNPAEYNSENIPLNPKHFLPVSIKGVKDGDFAMIYGYPGSTNRYETSYGIKQKIDIDNPNLVELRDARLKLMYAEMVKDPAVKLKLAGNYASVANYWKFFDGESKQLIKHNVIAQKEKEEKEFETWAAAKPEYANLFTNIKNTYQNWRPYSKHRVYFNEGINGSTLLGFAGALKQIDVLYKAGKNEDAVKYAKNLKPFYAKFIDAEDIPSDRNIVATVIKMFFNNIDENQRPQEFYTKLKTMGNLSTDEPYQKLAKQIFETSFILNKEKFEAFLEKPDTALLRKDEAYKTASAFVDNFNTNIAPQLSKFNAEIYALNNLYLRGVLEMRKGNEFFYPDANQTMRISYGNVKSYKPKDGVYYKEICTVKGITEKYVPGDYEFDAPAKLIDLINKKDFGQYADKQTNDIVVSFITNNDITGGNSGSPVLNAKGELIGLAFDGNYEALSHKLAVDKELNRTINLDIRYMLFVIEKLGGATNIINELNLIKI